MKHYKQSNAEIFDKGNAKVFEYNLCYKDIDWCIAEVSGRFPDKGWVMNTVCKEMVYIISGSGKIVIDGKGETHFETGDVVLVEPNEKYYWVAKAKLGITCSPTWYPEQHKTVE